MQLQSTLKKIAALTVAAVTCLTMVSCGSKPHYDFDLDPYLTLGDFSAASIKQSEIDSQLQEKINSLQSSKSTSADLKEGDVLQNGDTTKIDFTGKMNGEEFDKGSGEDYELKLGSGSFIDGFESGLVGKKVGESVTLELTFPDPYPNNPAYSGKPVTFEVTVKSAKRETVPTVDDAFIKENTDFETLEAYKADTTKSIKGSLAMTAFQKLCTVKEYPEAEYKEAFNGYFETYKQYAAMSGKSLSAFITESMGSTMEEQYKSANSYASSLVKQQMISYALARKNNITVSDAEFTEGIERLAKQYGYESAKELKKSSGATDDELRETLLMEKVSDWMAENITVTAVSETSDKASEKASGSSETSAAASETSAETSEEAPTTEPDKD